MKYKSSANSFANQEKKSVTGPFDAVKNKVVVNFLFEPLWSLWHRIVPSLEFDGYICLKWVKILYLQSSCMSNIYTLSFFYKQLALGCQIAKQLSVLNPLSLSNNKKPFRK